MDNTIHSQPIPSAEEAQPSIPSSEEPLDANLNDAPMNLLDTGAFETVQALQLELEQQKILTLRALADLDNHRKRTLKEKEDLRKFAVSGLVESLLPILDNFELGLKNVPLEAPASFVQGFQMVQEQLSQILKDFGLSSVDPQNEVFNPNTQECVAHLPHETVPENHIIQTIRKGYILQDKLLRSASVLVSSGASVEAAPGQTLA